MPKRKDEITIHSSAAEYLTYVATVGDNDGSMEMRYEDENIWLTQKMMATLYDVDVRTINEHIKKIYMDGELADLATIRKFRIVQTEGSRQVNREVIHYNLQMIIAIGFKVNNDRAVRFRKWSGQIVKDYTIHIRPLRIASLLKISKLSLSKSSTLKSSTGTASHLKPVLETRNPVSAALRICCLVLPVR